MGKRKYRNFYSIEKLVYENHHSHYTLSDDGTLFADAVYRTKIYAEDLPEWYVHGRYYKLWGYLSTKGITDLLYIPNKFTNHYLKDDCLLISYGGKIVPTEREKYYTNLDRYDGYDERVWGNEILDILKGARQYSGVDISGIIKQLKEKKEWLMQEYPDEFNADKWHFDIDESFSHNLDNGLPPKYYAITLNDYYVPGIASGTKRYYGTMKDMEAFIGSLNPKDFADTIAAFEKFKNGDTGATHIVAHNPHLILERVRFFTETWKCTDPMTWSYTNPYGFTHDMKIEAGLLHVIFILDGNEVLRCIKPNVMKLEGAFKEIIGKKQWDQVNGTLHGHPGIVKYIRRITPEMRCPRLCISASVRTRI